MVSNSALPKYAIASLVPNQTILQGNSGSLKVSWYHPEGRLVVP